ncbi:MAG: class I SAM-dependent methyltransferase [Sulfuritalea sp.]|nr:class I SAM-dependent methyltransferase [Sulfuritalea sp.]
MHLVNEILGRIRIVLGAMLLAFLGRDRFYLLAQGDGLTARICRAFAEHPYVTKQITGFKEINADINCERRSLASLEIYKGDSLAGWADTDRDRVGDGHLPLLQQMRSIVVPRVEATIEQNGTKMKTIVEIGVGNGDVIAYLADKYPQHHFVGVDLSVKTAEQLYPGKPNLEFKGGYALEMLENGSLKGDIVFGSSTFVVFPPKELVSYFQGLRRSGYTDIILVDPLTRRFTVNGAGPAFSKHMALGMWGHNYTGYFEKYGFKVSHFEVVNYVGHTKRPVVFFQLAHGKL